MSALATPICKTLSIQYPIFQAGMGWVARAALAAAVSEAGINATIRSSMRAKDAKAQFLAKRFNLS